MSFQQWIFSCHWHGSEQNFFNEKKKTPSPRAGGLRRGRRRVGNSAD
jgi:hypothetical protein